MATSSKSEASSPAEMPGEDGEWVRSGDPRGLRDLPEGAESSIVMMTYIKKRRITIIKIGKTNHRTGAMTIYTRESRLAANAEEIENSLYGLYFYWKPLEINGEDIFKLERGLGIGGHK